MVLGGNVPDSFIEYELLGVGRNPANSSLQNTDTQPSSVATMEVASSETTTEELQKEKSERNRN